MRQVIGLALVALLLLTSCTFLNIKDPVKEDLAIKIAARALGYKVAMHNKELTKDILPQAKAILAYEDVNQLVNDLWPKAIKWATEKASSDPLMAATLADVLSLVEVKDIPIDGKAIKIRLFLVGFIEGVELAI
jgi:hypothetical protein